MNTKHLLFAYSFLFTIPAVNVLPCKQTSMASFIPGVVSPINAGANRIFTSMYNMHCCC
jgi:hypothetical protein